ncbi:MAG TPA: hypothetical protein VF952_07155 [Chloroflexia bacterium]|jgi:hypothetical protein
MEQDSNRYRLMRRVQRNYESYCWDGAGLHSIEPAKAILWLVIEQEPPWAP